MAIEVAAVRCTAYPTPNAQKEQAVEDADIENLPELKKIAKIFVDEKLPIWKNLHIV